MNVLQVYDEDDAKQLACDYTCKRIVSFVITITRLSFVANLPMAWAVFKAIYEMVRKEYNNDSILGVLEKSQNKGYHLHLLHVSTKITTKKELEGMCGYFSKKAIIVNNITNNQEGSSVLGPSDIMVTGEHVKSPGGIFNYLQKQMLSVFVNDVNLAKAFMYFKREYVFPSGSTPKVRRLDSTLTMTKDKLVILFYNLFDEGKLDYSDIMKDVRIQPYLTKPNLKQIYTNVFQNYSSSLSHIKNLLIICNKYMSLPENERCCCPIIEFLKFQNTDITSFMKSTLIWLSCIRKRKCLWFYGPASCGKSHLARMLWKCFALNTRIVSDGLFSFANLIGSGCALWDEPFINPELVDQTKLVLEGEPDITITIKQKGAEKLGKRVPIIITSNSLL